MTGSWSDNVSSNLKNYSSVKNFLRSNRNDVNVFIAKGITTILSIYKSSTSSRMLNGPNFNYGFDPRYVTIF